jgi:hypothetical protein
LALKCDNDLAFKPEKYKLVVNFIWLEKCKHCTYTWSCFLDVVWYYFSDSCLFLSSISLIVNVCFLFIFNYLLVMVNMLLTA